MKTRLQYSPKVMWSWTALEIGLSNSFWMLRCQSWKYTWKSSSKQQNLSVDDSWASTAGSTQKPLNWNWPCLTFLFGISHFSGNLFPKSGSYCCSKTVWCPSSVDGNRVSYEKWLKTCASYPRTDQIPCDSPVQNLHLKSSGSAESRAGRRLEFVLMKSLAAASWVWSWQRQEISRGGKKSKQVFKKIGGGGGKNIFF